MYQSEQICVNSGRSGEMAQIKGEPTLLDQLGPTSAGKGPQRIGNAGLTLRGGVTLSGLIVQEIPKP
jgi:hypothetical protein